MLFLVKKSGERFAIGVKGTNGTMFYPVKDDIYTTTSLYDYSVDSFADVAQVFREEKAKDKLVNLFKIDGAAIIKVK
jgi:hypothetical protein